MFTLSIVVRLLNNNSVYKICLSLPYLIIHVKHIKIHIVI